MASTRTADTIQREIERARMSLAATVDELAERASPKRIANQTKQQAADKATSPAGQGVMGGLAALMILFMLVKRRRRRRRRRML